MRIDIITVIPELLQSPFQHSIMKRALEKGLLEVNVIPLRPYGLGPHKQLDDYQYGGGAGMVMMCEPLDRCIEDLKSQVNYDAIIYLTPDGTTFNQKIANRLSCMDHLMLICGHYKGIDQRIRDMHVTMELSVGDFVLSGGELAAALITDAVGRLIPGVLSDETSALTDSFQDDLLAPPVYTRPSEYKGLKVPDVLLSGNDRLIETWRQEAAYRITEQKRPDLLEE
ncbi:MAG: tRNA (guanosine(37)-N1)-methyltransferase TrmD [Chitinophagales bacterium]|nr:tRNA (guanosine(37)-N1)-methyltransferase TrmD [Chitinophagales bacterium]